jgi:spoIIIJ-associated protein
MKKIISRGNKMEYKEFSAKTVDDAITDACTTFSVTSDKLDYVVVEEASTSFFGLKSKPAVIKARLKEIEIPIDQKVEEFLSEVLKAMSLEATVKIDYNEEEKEMDIELVGEDMGLLIGKRGATLDSLQYLASLVANKEAGEYIRVKLDTENYRERRKKTLENLAKNMAFKVKRTRRSVSLEPMNPYERRVIHSALQNDKYVTTHSEGEEPFRHVVITMKK